MIAASRVMRSTSQDAAWHRLRHAASAPYRRTGHFAWHFARGKLGRDPVFRAILERGDVGPGPLMLDLGCGQGLLASLLAASVHCARNGGWPAEWPQPPRQLRYTGIEMMARDVERATASLGSLPGAPQFICADMCQVDLPRSDLIVILDVLHYVDYDAQAALLARVRAALASRGRLLLRVGDTGQRWRFAISQWVDRMVTGVRGHHKAPTWGRSLAEWTALLRNLGFTVAQRPMSQGTPFANVLLVCDAGEVAR
jgi:SAM-dependent methyltransferase